MKAMSKDAVSRNYFADSARFSQVCNNALFNGESVIEPEKLRELDTTELKTMGLDSRYLTFLRNCHNIKTRLLIIT